MKTWLFALCLASCGPSPSAETRELEEAQRAEPQSERIEEANAGPNNAGANNEMQLGEEATREDEGTRDGESNGATNGDEREAPPGPQNFVTPHHCHRPGPCSFEFETLRGPQYIDVGHGHSDVPALRCNLAVGEGRAALEGIRANIEAEGNGVVVSRPRESLEGGAYYVTLTGHASQVRLELSFADE